MAGQRSSYGKRSHSHSDHDNGRHKRKNHGDDRDQFVIDSEDTVYRYLCPVRRIGSIIGKGGEIVKQLRIDTKAKIRIGETVPGCDERVVTIYSSSDETNGFEDSGNYISPAQDALFRVHDRVIAEELHSDDESERTHQIIARLLVPSDQIGCIIGKGGQIVQNIRSDTGAQIRILKDDHLPACALNSDELVQILGEAAVVKKALYQIASRLHENPSRSQHMLTSAISNVYPSGGSLITPTAGGPIVGIAPLMNPYGGYKGDSGDWSRSLYSAPRDEMSLKEFSLRLVCPIANIGGVIGKGGAIINQIRQESGAAIKVDSSATEGDDCLITISAKEYFEDNYCPTVEAAVRLQPRCSEKIERDSGIISFTTRLLVPTSRIGCLIGKGGAIITEMRRLTKANIRILSKDGLPKVASEDDEMVQIAGDLDVAKDALVQVITRLRANLFDREGAVSAVVPVLPYLPVSTDGSDGLHYESRDSKRSGRYSGGYGSSDLAVGESYGTYGGSQVGGGGSAYEPYGSYSSTRTGTSGLSDQAPISRRKSYGY
ncbi:KH_1 domain-containing protein [Cephalotus follicularis]|uniref:KH_1 domain-containing protein n=1 Tax=Cephalotus follicularis TaxID=3775 RepID=A0A1Q3C0I2_CEPFO|nr:KH_1 domain-containing protein [Cephalotus follicularis]